MKNQPLKRTAIKGLLCAALLLAGGVAWAGQVAGTVVHLSGPLMVKKADGTVKVLALKSEVESGDTLVSEKNTYAQIRFIDNSEITLRPGTTFRIENFAFEAGKPEADNAAFNLIKGGLREISGMLGKRNREKFSLKTPGATIGIRGTTFVAQWVEPQPEDTPTLAPGLHVQVIDGAIFVTNNGGSMGFQAGQFGYVPSTVQPPVIVPPGQGVQFVPPPSFSGTPAGPEAGAQDKTTVDCIVK